VVDRAHFPGAKEDDRDREFRQIQRLEQTSTK
jgi:hypothetical protein